MMQKTLIPVLMTLVLLLGQPVAAANCYADYKAKKDAPLRLHYGVIQLNGACKKAPAKAEIAGRGFPLEGGHC